MSRKHSNQIFASWAAASFWQDVESSVLDEVDHLKLEGKTRQQVEELIMGAGQYADLDQGDLFVILDEQLDRVFG